MPRYFSSDVSLLPLNIIGLLKDIPKSKTSIVSGDSGSGKSTTAAKISIFWAEASDGFGGFDIIIHMSVIQTKIKLAYPKFAWGESVLKELNEKEEKVLFVCDSLGKREMKSFINIYLSVEYFIFRRIETSQE